mmetsp:Transcript_28587/g.57651  ORF Transcript_28587/g.57651 Transcript_28587/m.57651 type:complete len:219 (-) Transcript_28587:328-984(-)
MAVPTTLGFLRRHSAAASTDVGSTSTDTAAGTASDAAADAASADAAADAAADATGNAAADAASDAAIASELVAVTKLAEPSRWAEHADEEVEKVLGAAEISSQLSSHATRIVQVQRAMYLDAAHDVHPPAPPGAPRVSIFRVTEHMNKLEAAMSEHVQWYGPEASRRAAAATAPPAATAGKAVGGFGGGAGGMGKGAGAKKGTPSKGKAKAKGKKQKR